MMCTGNMQHLSATAGIHLLHRKHHMARMRFVRYMETGRAFGRMIDDRVDGVAHALGDGCPHECSHERRMFRSYRDGVELPSPRFQCIDCGQWIGEGGDQ